MLGQKRNDSLFGPGSRTIEAPQSVLEKQEAALEGSPLDEAVQPLFESQTPAAAFTDADDLPRRTIATEAAAGQRVHSLFFTPESESKDFSSVLQDVQEYISGKYSTLITDGVGADTKEQIKRYISKYVQDRRIAVRDLSGEQLVDALYTEMAEFGFLTKYIFGSGIEEININSWRDIEVLYSSGQMVKLEEHFDSPDHAINVIRRMLHVSGMVLDNASPAVLGHLSKNIRIAVLKTPLVDEDVGVCASIRIVNPQNMQKEDFVRGGTATGPMLDFLSACLRYGVSVCVAGATGSGKTTVAGWLLTTIPDNKRIFTIENGSRELDLVREKNGRVTNSVIHTITRESENAKQSVDQDTLLDMALRYHPDIICVGEMRSAEAYAAQEAARTGHGVLTTIHSNSSQATWRRMVTLCKRKHEMADDTLMDLVTEAFPVTVFAKQLEDKSRKIMEIMECETLPDGSRQYNTLYRFRITENRLEDGKFHIVIQEALRLGELSQVFLPDEDTVAPEDLPELLCERNGQATEAPPAAAWSKRYKEARQFLYGSDGHPQDQGKALALFRTEALAGNDLAMYALAKLLLDRGEVSQDLSEALRWLRRSAELNNQFAQYRLSKLLLQGELLPQNVEEALQWLMASAQQGNQFAQYALGKLYLLGKEVPQDRDAAGRWLSLAAAQGNEYAQYFLDHMDDRSAAPLLLSATRLLHHLGNIFREQEPPPRSGGMRIAVDRKLLQKIREKKTARGHKWDDHEPSMSL